MMQVAVCAMLIAWWGSRSWPSHRLELPEGQSCDVHDREGDVTCVPHATWQQLMAAKASLSAESPIFRDNRDKPPRIDQLLSDRHTKLLDASQVSCLSSKWRALP